MPGGANAVTRHHVTAAALVTLSVLLLAIMGGVAGAKGPESATIIGPGIEEPVELIRTDNFEQVERLLEETGIWYGDSLLPRVEPPAVLGPAYALTWIAGPTGAPTEERTIHQRIYLEAEGGPVIHTPQQAGLDHWGDVIGWGRASGELRGALLAFGLPIPANATPAAGSESKAPDRETPAVAPETQPAAGLPRSHWYLAVLGGMAVVGLARAASRLRAATDR